MICLNLQEEIEKSIEIATLFSAQFFGCCMRLNFHTINYVKYIFKAYTLDYVVYVWHGFCLDLARINVATSGLQILHPLLHLQALIRAEYLWQ